MSYPGSFKLKGIGAKKPSFKLREKGQDVSLKLLLQRIFFKKGTLSKIRKRKKSGPMRGKGQIHTNDFLAMVFFSFLSRGLFGSIIKCFMAVLSAIKRGVMYIVRNKFSKKLIEPQQHGNKTEIIEKFVKDIFTTMVSNKFH